MPLNPFSVKCLRPEEELIHLPRMHRHHRHKSRRKRCRTREM